MPTKRPDQLPEGEDFDFNDILMVEKFPNSESRKLYKTKLRTFMESALKMDPERMGQNAILGLQSKFEWLVQQMETLAEANAFDIQKYSDFESDSKSNENEYIPPTPSITPSLTPTPTPSKDFIQPSPTPTPTPSATPPQTDYQITVNGSTSSFFDLPNNYLPQKFGFTSWEIVPGNASNGISPYFQGTRPDNFQPSLGGEKLSLFTRDSSSDSLIVRTHIIRNEGDEDNEEILNMGGIQNNSQLTFTIRYS